MKKERNVYILETTDYKILETVYLLNKYNYYPLAEGVYKILTGSDDDEIEEFKDFVTYKTLVSYSSKKVSRFIVMLLRYKYLERIYDEKTDKLYLKVSPKGEMELVNYHKKHKYNFVKKKVNKTKTIIKIEK